MQSLAKELQLTCYHERYYRNDVVLEKLDAEGGWPVPVIIIESENQLKHTEDEVMKLAYLNAPLKVLITYCSNWRELRDEYTKDHWNYMLKSFASTIGLVGLFGIVIIGIDEYYCMAYNAESDDFPEEHYKIPT